MERLIAEIWPACFRLAASLIGDWSLAQDAAQEACVIVHRKITALKNPSAFDAWMYRVVTREVLRIRRRHAAGTIAAYEQTFSTDDTEGIDVWRAIAGLPSHLRDVTVLFYFDDLKTEEISRILAIPHSTVRTRLSRARKYLRSALGDYAIDSEAHSNKVEQHAW